ncbi:MAG: InlB B-repeat-containing protein [Treponema sp.]|nr:InlB B-repeat-containing protein [Treponema sp.]
MKNTDKFKTIQKMAGITAFAAVIGFLIAACDLGSLGISNTEPVSYYTVTYNGNGNNSGTVPADSGNYESGSSVTVLGNTGSLAREGYIFIGWNTAGSGSGTNYAPGDSFTITGNTVLYARWNVVLPGNGGNVEPVSYYTVTYNGNGNNSGTAPADSGNYESGSSVTVLGNTGGLGRDGYVFIGWNTADSGAGTNYAPGDSFTITEKITLYAQWDVILSEGVYIFYPRIQATKGGLPQEEYLDRIEVTGNYTKIYLNNNVNGGRGRTAGNWGSYLARNSVILKDIVSNNEYNVNDSSYPSSQGNIAYVNGYTVLVFENVRQGTMFSLTNSYGGGAPSVFANVNLTGSNVKAPVNKPALPDGITTFTPEIKIKLNGVDIADTYSSGSCALYQVAVSDNGRYMNITLGVSSAFEYQNWTPSGSWILASSEANSYNVKLVDLDNPWAVYEPMTVSLLASGTSERFVITFENVKAARFSLTSYYGGNTFAFWEVNIGD